MNHKILFPFILFGPLKKNICTIIFTAIFHPSNYSHEQRSCAVLDTRIKFSRVSVEVGNLVEKP